MWAAVLYRIELIQSQPLKFLFHSMGWFKYYVIFFGLLLKIQLKIWSSITVSENFWQKVGFSLGRSRILVGFFGKNNRILVGFYRFEVGLKIWAH